MEMAAALPSSWEELPPDLLGLVLRRLPSLADRAHLRAVCRPWRAGAHPQRHKPLPPPLPWLALRDGTLVDLRGAPVRCASILREGVFRYLAVDNLAFLVDNDGGCSLMNPLSGLTLPLSKLAPAVSRALENSAYDQSYARKTHAKVILSSPIDSTPDPLVAIVIRDVVIRDGLSLAISPSKDHDAISISMPPEWPGGLPTSISDIAFLHGELYALTVYEGLYIKLDVIGLCEPNFFHQCIVDDPKQQKIYTTYQQWQQQIYFEGPGRYSEYMVMRYIAESNGRLLMVRRWMSFPSGARLGDYDTTFRFDVFEADLTTVPGRWTKVENLGGQTLFLGSQCTKSVPASQCAGGVQEDCIYFMHRVFDNPCKEYIGPCVNPLGDSGVYNMRDGKITPFLPEPVMAELQRKRQFLTWFFPADA
ncbi:unnamed protein product [Urochloa decumbens]|uniref:DUF295 domain-containing protein n=1 Tax=Urochloa decumbens TaxID=240449 RepID=A0ABC9C0E1_9POAL